MDENLYDEFGNYIGPDLDDDDASGDEWLEPMSKVTTTITSLQRADSITTSMSSF